MGDIEAGLEPNLLFIAGTTLISVVILFFSYKFIFSSKKKEAVKYQAESDTGKKYVYLI